MSDYIKKSKAIQVLKDYAKQAIDKRVVSFDIVDDTLKMCDLIEKAETEDVAPVIHARWIKSCPNIIFDGCYHCSNCKENIDIATGEETPLDRGLNYCPNCGAKMDLKE